VSIEQQGGGEAVDVSVTFDDYNLRAERRESGSVVLRCSSIDHAEVVCARIAAAAAASQ
jgi:hypothetical protein